MRVWLLTNAPSPYQEELFAEVRRQGQIDLTVAYLRDDSPAAPGAGAKQGTVLGGFGLGRDELRVHPAALRAVRSGEFDVCILSGLYTSPTFLACAASLHRRGRPWAVWLEQPRRGKAEAPWSSGVITAGPVRAVRTRVLRAVLRAAPRTIGIGTAAVEAYRELADLPADRLLSLPYCCNVDRYGRVAPEAVAAVRRQWGLEDDQTVVLFSGQMIARKGVETAIAAFAEVADDVPTAVLVLLGEGPERATYEAAVPAGLRDRVRFVGFRPQAELPACFAAARVFLFPSRHDGWAVVINEACGAGLPIVVSRQTGAARDLVVPGENGVVVDRDDVSGFATGLRGYLLDSDRAAQHGAASRARVAQFDAAAGAATLAHHAREIAAASGAIDSAH